MKSTIIPKITRVYISVKRIADNYYEAKYKDFYSDGTVAAYGCEDFSGERLRDQTKQYSVHVYNGKVMHGVRHDGWRMTDNVGTIRISHKSSGLAAAKLLYKNVARVQKL